MAERAAIQAPAALGPLVITTRPLRACIELRGEASDTRFVRAVASVTDLEPPPQPNTSANGLLGSLLWLGPSQWWFASETQDPEALVQRLREALTGQHAAVTDLSAARTVYTLSGSYGRDVLAKGCSIDLHARRFAVGTCAQTLLGKLAVLIHLRAPEPVFDVYVGRSFAEHAWKWFEAAAVARATPMG